MSSTRATIVSLLGRILSMKSIQRENVAIELIPRIITTWPYFTMICSMTPKLPCRVDERRKFLAGLTVSELNPSLLQLIVCSSRESTSISIHQSNLFPRPRRWTNLRFRSTRSRWRNGAIDRTRQSRNVSRLPVVPSVEFRLNILLVVLIVFQLRNKLFVRWIISSSFVESVKDWINECKGEGDWINLTSDGREESNDEWFPSDWLGKVGLTIAWCKISKTNRERNGRSVVWSDDDYLLRNYWKRKA